MAREGYEKAYYLEVMLHSGKYCRYRQKDSDAAVAEARRLAKAIRAKKQMFFELYQGQFLRLSEITFVGISSGLFSGWH